MDLVCYNRGCGQRFKEDENGDSSCQYHSGAPIFHEGYKGWSCCKKKTTDFTEFLNIPGCAKGPHSNVKPPEPVKQIDKPLEVGEVIKSEPEMKQAPPNRTIQRPSDNMPKIRLKLLVASSLKSMLKRLYEQQKQNQHLNEKGATDDTIRIGAPCKNRGCSQTFTGDDSNDDECIHHPGFPIFHEGYKYWTCCTKRTSDFNEFLKQVGCETGKHDWIKPSEIAEKKSVCRYDWYQTGSNVFVSIYAKASDPEKTFVEANQTSIYARIAFNGAANVFELNLNLFGLIAPEQSSIELMGTKVEIKLRKLEAFGWKTLEHRDKEKESIESKSPDDS